MFQGNQPVSRAAFLRTTFPADFATFWDSIPTEERDELLFTMEGLRFYRDTVLSNLPRPTNEDMLSQHLDSRYTQPHNWTKTQNHSEIIRRDDGYGLVGKPDYLFVAHGTAFRALHAIMELKTFWKVTADSIIEVLDGNFPFSFAEFVKVYLLYTRLFQ
jgi:hypothetical protein